MKTLNLDLGRRYQNITYKYALKLLKKPNTKGLILADGVGMGKTYEALATAFRFIVDSYAYKTKKRRKKVHIIIVTPPNLVKKWEDEISNPDKWWKYINRWKSHEGKAFIMETFRYPEVIRREDDLHEISGTTKHGRVILPEGLYIVNKNVIEKTGKKITQLKSTKWDIVITDEVHHYADKEWLYDLIDADKTKVLFLTATPFQLQITELKELLDLLDDEVYGNNSFNNYRKKMNALFNKFTEKDQIIKDIREAKRETEALLRNYIIRNQRNDRRVYYIVNSDESDPRKIDNFSTIEESSLNDFISRNSLIRVSEDFKYYYLRSRDHIATLGNKTFVSTLLREILSSYSQFRNSETGIKMNHLKLSEESHPKIKTLVLLVKKLLSEEIKRFSKEKNPFIEKILIFVKFIGTQHEGGGTLRVIKKLLKGAVNGLIGKASELSQNDKNIQVIIDKWLHLGSLEKIDNLDYIKKCGFIVKAKSYRIQSPDIGNSNYLSKLNHVLQKGFTRYLLTNENLRKEEMRFIKKQILNIEKEWVNWDRCRKCSEEETLSDKACSDCKEVENVNGNLVRARRHKERAENLMKNLYARYATRDLVSSYTGADFSTREQHKQGFNSPFAPLILIASSVGEEGIDLQKYCSHIIHYDLEWNAAKMEQREGRVDRIGRLSREPVKVYFLLCKDTYEERILQVLKNRERWYRLIIGRNKILENDAMDGKSITSLKAKEFNKLSLDLRPK